ncbi:MAG: DegT/DnrJ/EryC1/StrS family aminotransferase [Lachnospiraceae bacterium]|nr:DegT/DnrJ/EryC1/StrS family aminotransferase [Lachnospiraceae bacterium]
MKELAKNNGIPVKQKPFPNWPIYDEREIRNVTETVKSQNWWRVTGTKVKEFEAAFSKFQGCSYCLGVTNGTSAIELALNVLGVGEGDEVIVPGMTFISTGLAVLNCNAVPVLVDIDKNTLCMLPEAFEAAITEKTKVVIPVHMAGHGCQMDKICDIARKHGIKVIEDAAHGHGGEYKHKRLGSYGDFAIFSFQNGKLMTSGEGGALLTNSKEYYEKAYVIQDVGRPIGDKIYEHVIRGANYRMNEFQAAILLAQMERVDEYNQLRDKNAICLDTLLENVEGIIPQGRTEEANIITHYMYMFYYDASCFGGLPREEFVEYLNAEGIPCCICFPVLSDTEFFLKNDFNGMSVSYDKKKEADLTNSRRAGENMIWLHHRTLEGDYDDLKDIVLAIEKIRSSFVQN